MTTAVSLKEDQVQFVSNETGDVPAENPSGFGLYWRDTRFLNRFELTVNGLRPVFLSNSLTKRYIATFQSVNPNLVLSDGTRVRQQTLSIRRSRFVTGQGLYERVGVLNCNHFEVGLDLVLAVDADFRDIFAVRNFVTQRVAGQISATFGGENVVFAYRGRDGVERWTELGFSREPEAISMREVRFSLKLKPREFDSIVIQVQPHMEGISVPMSADFDQQLELLAASYTKWDEESTRISTDNTLFDRELLRATRYDIRTLIERTRFGNVPDAGIPWYAVPFGRDAIITSLQGLMYNPSLAEGTLRFLAANQGKEVNEAKEEEPGKIMHELRRGELARLNEVPHTPYFGTIDATPLFLILFVEAMDWVDDDRLFDDVLPAARACLQWIDRYGDVDGDGYVEYVSHRPGGVLNHGWKDSVDAVQYQDGSNALPPIALVEVQGYVYQAKVGMARLLRRKGMAAEAEPLDEEARALKERFNRDFWMEEEGFYAQALDGNKKQIASITSNAGHCLWSGICNGDKADRLVDRLLKRDMFSGWGIRTLSSDSPNYNPMSYHNGSVWPHDTALIALGMRRAGYQEPSVMLIQALIEAGFRFADGRLPELFCGFSRDQRFNSSPAAYMVSCVPQAWAAGSVLMLLQGLLDIRPHPEDSSLRVNPVLPELFHELRLENLRVGGGHVDLLVEKGDQGVRVEAGGDGAERLQVEAAA